LRVFRPRGLVDELVSVSIAVTLSDSDADMIHDGRCSRNGVPVANWACCSIHHAAIRFVVEDSTLIFRHLNRIVALRRTVAAISTVYFANMELTAAA